MDVCKNMVEMTRTDPEWMQKIITGDETWMYQYDPETKRQSSQWIERGEPKPKKAIFTKSKVKTLLFTFFYINGLVHHEFIPFERTINQEVYLGIMRRLREAVSLKRPERWQNNDWILHVDNARPHTAHVVLQFLAKHSTIQIPHPPYSPDLATNDFFLYLKLKMKLKGRKFDNVDMIQAESKATLRNLSKNDFISCFDNRKKKRWNREHYSVAGRDLAPKEMAAFDMRNSCHGEGQQQAGEEELSEVGIWMVVTLGGYCWKSATDGHRLLCEANGKHALSIKSCEYWFRRFKSGDFDTRDKERGGRPIKFEDAELEALLDEDSSQTQEELAETSGVTQQAISNRLKVMGMVQKQGNWVPYELKPGNIERRICTCKLLLKRQNRKGFLHRIVTGDEKWIHYDNPKRRKSSVKPGHASTSTAKPNIHGKKLMLCIWWDQLGVIYYELLQPNETITGERYQQQLMRLSRALKFKRPLYGKRHDKVIYQHDDARPHVAKVVKETLEALQWDVLPHPLYSPDIAPSDYHMFHSMTHGLAEQHFTSYEESKNWVNVWIASKDEEFFRHGIRMLPERWEKVVAKDGQYFE
ncbi:SETMAR [Cordylochernes scorpioides]|uniref:SETMAR n=1 Tax=Cordylochernes scorpioides TaxID=51811 RepID=A0ABY6LI98_9ARAC|nr:SETMAR [Cordylochernes scorpioides]